MIKEQEPITTINKGGWCNYFRGLPLEGSEDVRTSWGSDLGPSWGCRGTIVGGGLLIRNVAFEGLRKTHLGQIGVRLLSDYGGGALKFARTPAEQYAKISKIGPPDLGGLYSCGWLFSRSF